MNTPLSRLASRLIVLVCLVVMTGCNNEEASKPQIADIESVGCLIANDFYAVHFSAYVQPSAENMDDREALLRPYCQELPGVGKVFFSADLIDRDVRKTLISIRIVEVEKTTNPDEPVKEIRTLLEVPDTLYPKGVVEANTTIDKIGDYAMILTIGGEDAFSEDDSLYINFHVGKQLFALSTQMLFLLATGLFLLIAAVYFFYRRRKK